MANYYSDHFSTTVGATSVDDPPIKAPPGISHSALRYKRGSVTVAAGVTDDEQCHFFPLKSTDRLIHLYLSTPSLTGTTMTADLGVYRTPEDGGALVDLDLFCAAATSPCDDLTVAIARVDCFALGALEDEDRGKMLYQLVDEGLATTAYDNDPKYNFSIVLTMNTETSVTAGAEIVLEAVYTAGAGS